MIDVINLEKSFGNNKVLKGINITIEKGDIMAVSYTHLTLPTNSRV